MKVPVEDVCVMVDVNVAVTSLQQRYTSRRQCQSTNTSFLQAVLNSGWKAGVHNKNVPTREHASALCSKGPVVLSCASRIQRRTGQENPELQKSNTSHFSKFHKPHRLNSAGLRNGWKAEEKKPVFQAL